MNILGIHMGHDASLALVKNGKLFKAVAMERYSGEKKSSLITKEYLNRFLWDCDITIDQIDTITMSHWEWANAPFMSIYSPKGEEYPLRTFGRDHGSVSILNHLEEYWTDEIVNWKPEYIEGRGFTLPNFWDRIRPPHVNTTNRHRSLAVLNVFIDGYDKPIDGFFVDHQLSHASSAFFTSPFESAAVFTADASGPEHGATSSFCVGQGNNLMLFKNPQCQIGTFYDLATEYTGIGPGLEKAGVLMGLAAYGDVSKKVKDNSKEWTMPLKHRQEEEDYLFNDWLFLQMSGRYPFTLEKKRPEIENQEHNWEKWSREYQMVYTKKESDTQRGMNLAADIQYMAERGLVEYASQLFEESKNVNNGNLCVAGGIFLNCNANYKILRESGFKQMHMFPSCGDDGLSVGSALYINHCVLRNPRQVYQNKELMYLGYEYPDIPESKYKSQPLDLDVVADNLEQGKIVCWYQGGGEMGPRALGHRSFLVDPRKKEMKDILNSRVKYREWYRPFAPIVLNEFKEEWFRMDFESPFMLFTVPCKRPFDIPSGVHIDNTARVQTLRKEDNDVLYNLIHKFYERTEVPILLNTSLNIKGRPIVEDPWQAMKLFDESDVDILVINNLMYFKSND
jgi:carbamoyltransferase